MISLETFRRLVEQHVEGVLGDLAEDYGHLLTILTVNERTIKSRVRITTKYTVESLGDEPIDPVKAARMARMGRITMEALFPS